MTLGTPEMSALYIYQISKVENPAHYFICAEIHTRHESETTYFSFIQESICIEHDKRGKCNR